MALASSTNGGNTTSVWQPWQERGGVQRANSGASHRHTTKQPPHNLLLFRAALAFCGWQIEKTYLAQVQTHSIILRSFGRRWLIASMNGRVFRFSMVAEHVTLEKIPMVCVCVIWTGNWFVCLSGMSMCMPRTRGLYLLNESIIKRIICAVSAFYMSN